MTNRKILLVAFFFSSFTSCPLLHRFLPGLWYRSDSGVVRQGDQVKRWLDISGKDNHTLEQGAGFEPTYIPNSTANGLPSLRFTGGQFLRCPDVFPILSDYTKIVVLRINNVAAYNNILSGAGNHALWMGVTRLPRIFHSADFVTSYREVPDAFSILACTFDDSELHGELFVNGGFGGAGYTTLHNAGKRTGESFILARLFDCCLIRPSGVSSATIRNQQSDIVEPGNNRNNGTNTNG